MVYFAVFQSSKGEGGRVNISFEEEKLTSSHTASSLTNLDPSAEMYFRRSKKQAGTVMLGIR